MFDKLKKLSAKIYKYWIDIRKLFSLLRKLSTECNYVVWQIKSNFLTKKKGDNLF